MNRQQGDRNKFGGDRARTDRGIGVNRRGDQAFVCCFVTPGGGGGHGPVFLRSLTIANSQVPSTQNDFPVLVNITNATLKTIANGGHVQRSDGFDIGFYSDALGTTKLKWEMERYTPTTGEVIAWVKIGTVSSALNTVFYMAYGNSSITTDQSDPPNVWTNGFLGVYHLKDGSTLNVNDSTSHANNGTNNGVTATVGQIDGAGAFSSSSNQYIALPASMNPLTHSAWVNATSFPNALNAVIVKDGLVVQGIFALWVRSDGKLEVDVGQTTHAIGTATLSTSTWYHLVMVYSPGVGLRLYINGALDTSTGDNGGNYIGTNVTWIGEDTPNIARFWNGKIDEAHISSVARSSDWITTEYNNQVSGSTFVTLGPEI